MRSYCAIYVDVGYLLAAAATRVTGTSLRRGVQVDHAGLIDSLIERAQQDSGLPLLRVNWYDSGGRPGGMPDFVQDEIGLLPRVKLRLGRLSHAGEQKGVDLRIGLDLATHGRNRVVDVIYLVSGDDDLTEAVEEAQGHGVQVLILAVPGQDGRPHGVSRHLQRAADALVLLDGEMIDHVVRSRAIPEELVPDEYRPEDGAEGEATDEVAAAAPDGAGEPIGPDADEFDTAGPDGAAGAAPETTEAGPERESPTEGASPAEAEPVPAPPFGDIFAIDAPGPEEPEPVAAPGPSPSIFAKRKATAVVPPPEPLWPTPTTSPGPGGARPAVDEELIDAVARQVVRSWCTTATPEDLADLKAQRPSIPPDLDRALLMDLSTRTDHYDIDEDARHELRHRFWQLIDQVKLT